MTIWIVTAYTPYEGSDVVAVYSREPTADEMTQHRKDYNHKESVDWEKDTTVD